MESLKNTTSFLVDLIGLRASTIGIAVLSLLLFLPWLTRGRMDEPPTLTDVVPFIANTYQYMTNQRLFLNRASRVLQAKNIAKFHLGPMTVYLLSGAHNVQSMFRTSSSIGSTKFMLRIYEHLQGITATDLAKLAADRSGRLKVPMSGTENTPEDKRYWAALHNLFHEHLIRGNATNALAESYYRFFGERLEEMPLMEWMTVSVFAWLKDVMAESATISLCGKRILEVNPTLVRAMWDLDKVALQLVWGLPKWINPRPIKLRQVWNGMGSKFLDIAFEEFDWNGPDSNADWEPVFGSSYAREYAKWAKKSGFELESRAGQHMTHIIAVNSNTIPITAWAMMKLIKDSSLFQSIRDEVIGVTTVDPTTGKHNFNIEELLALPLLQSVYIECMRMYVSINITRELEEPIVLNGFKLRKDGILQAPTEISHYEETVWAKDGHPASEFWAERHVKLVEVIDSEGRVSTKRELSMAGRSNDFFPFGGGVAICPGRFFAKQEIMLTLAMVVARFDIEFVEWTKLDGSASDREAKADVMYCGAAAVHPDRDMKIRWKRLW